MRSRREIKKSWMKMKMVMKFSTRHTIRVENDAELINELKQCDVESVSEIERKQAEVKKNDEINEIFSMLWIVLKEHIVDGILSEEGYCKLNLYIQTALIKNIQKEEAEAYAKHEYALEIQTFHVLDKTAFNNMLMELLGKLPNIYSKIIVLYNNKYLRDLL